MKILVTGGAGYLGTELIYSLAARKDVTEVIIYDNLSRGNYNLFIGHVHLPAKIKLVQADILDTRTLQKNISECDIIYHLAATVTTPFSDQTPHLFEQVNNWGTAELSYAVENSNVQKLIYVSSVSVYGSGDEEVDVQSAINPRTFYGISKMRGEEHVNRLSAKKQVYVMRCGNVYGYSKSMRFDAVMNKFLFDANFRKRITINGSGEQYRSFIHVDKAVAVLSSLIDNTLTPSVYNLAERILSINDIAYTLKEIYPDMEMLYTNQHIKLRQIKVKPDAVVNRYFADKTASFEEELRTFAERFTF
jgi:UDP-glucose 4-epimerase